MDLPGYDAWKTSNPDDDRCEFCGVHRRECREGWQPRTCTGECKRGWRDPDYEYEKMKADGGGADAMLAERERK